MATTAMQQLVTGFAFTKLVVGDLAGLEKFYCTALGMKVTARIDVNEGSWNLEETILSVADNDDGPHLNLIHYREKPVPPMGETVIGLKVSDLDAVIADVVAAGGVVAVPPVRIPDHNLRLAYISDPEGHLVELLQYL